MRSSTAELGTLPAVSCSAAHLHLAAACVLLHGERQLFQVRLAQFVVQARQQWHPAASSRTTGKMRR